MTDKLRELLEDVQTVYEGKGMVVHPNSFDKLRMEIIKLDNINKQQSEQIDKMKRCEICKNYSGLCGCSYHHLWTEDCKANGMKLFELEEIEK